MLFVRFSCLLLPALLLSCGTQTTTPVETETKPLTEAAQQASIERLKLDFNAPVLIDSSVYVMYPLVLNSKDLGEDEYGSRRGRENTYWNIVFYNTATGESHLLDESKKMVINSYSSHDTGISTEEIIVTDFNHYQKGGSSRVAQLLYYDIRINDFNKDGTLDEKDPSYLFVSDKAGNNFRQISPPNYNVSDWRLLKGTNKILVRATVATADNRSTDDENQIVPFVYDLNTNGPAREVFNPAFITKAKKLLNSQWLKRPQ